jgi:hypothetical protein
VDREVKIVAVRIGRPRFRVGTIGRTFGGLGQAVVRQPLRDLFLIVDLEAEMVPEICGAD